MQILPVWIIYVAALMRIVGGMAYFRATLSGHAKPKAMSWLVWSIAPFITFAAALSSGVGIEAIITLALGISPLMVVLAALKTDRRLFYLDKFDSLCILIAFLGVTIWAITKEPVTAIVLAIAADFISAIPIIRKALQNPASEYPPTYLLSASAMILALLATEEISFAAFAFPVYILFVNLTIAFVAMRPSHKKLVRKQVSKTKRRPTKKAKRR